MRWLLVTAVLLLAGCSAPVTAPTNVTSTTPAGPPGGAHFDGAKALDAARAQVISPNGSIRYRVPGTAGNHEAATLIADNLTALGWNVTWDRWNGSYQCRNTPMHNVIAERAGDSGKVVLLGAHYDTRPIAESDANPDNRTKPIPGANDGASGVAVLLELARVMPPTRDTIRLIFFDAEDGGDLGDGCTQWLIGSSHDADNMSPADIARTKVMLLVDLVGDPNLRLPRELLTYNHEGRPYQDRVYSIAGSLGYAQFTNETRGSYVIEDDHQPYQQHGIPAVDLIHLVPDARQVFPEWHHTQHDDLTHVSASSLEAVGRVLETWLREGAQSGP